MCTDRKTVCISSDESVSVLASQMIFWLFRSDDDVVCLSTCLSVDCHYNLMTDVLGHPPGQIYDESLILEEESILELDVEQILAGNVIDYLNSQGRSERWKSKKDWFEVGHGGYMNSGLRRHKETPWMVALLCFTKVSPDCIVNINDRSYLGSLSHWPAAYSIRLATLPRLRPSKLQYL